MQRSFIALTPFLGQKISCPSVFLTRVNTNPTMQSVFSANKHKVTEEENRAHSSQNCQISVRILWVNRSHIYGLDLVQRNTLSFGQLSFLIFYPTVGFIFRISFVLQKHSQKSSLKPIWIREPTLSPVVPVSRYNGECSLQQARLCISRISLYAKFFT